MWGLILYVFQAKEFKEYRRNSRSEDDEEIEDDEVPGFVQSDNDSEQEHDVEAEVSHESDDEEKVCISELNW